MSMSKDEMTQRVYSRLAADLSNPTYTDIHVDNLYRWANEEVNKVINKLDKDHYHDLITLGLSLTNEGGGSFTLPSLFLKPLAVTVTTNRIACELLKDAEEFKMWDSRNFILTPSLRKPIAFIGDTVYVKPTSVTVCYLDFISEHPDISSMPADTSLSAMGDTMLVNLLVARCFAFLEEPELAMIALQDAMEVKIDARK